MNPRHLLLALTLAAIALVSVCLNAQCPIKLPPSVAVYPGPTGPPLQYPMLSALWAVQYKVGARDWKDATVYISYYGGTDASPYLTYSEYNQWGTSMSFVSIPADKNTEVQLLVTRTSPTGSIFIPFEDVSVRPSAM